MKKQFLFTLSILFVAGIALADQPKVKVAKIEPAVATVGDTVKMVVEFTGKQKDLKEVSFIVREFQYETPRYYLKADKNSKKNRWILMQPIPYEAPSQVYHLDLRALDKDGKEIVTKGYEKQVTGKAGSVKLEIK